MAEPNYISWPGYDEFVDTTSRDVTPWEFTLTEKLCCERSGANSGINTGYNFDKGKTERLDHRVV